jgi:hypothetical protein
MIPDPRSRNVMAARYGLMGLCVWRTFTPGPIKGDIEIAFGISIGLYGFIYAKGLEFELQPLTDLSIA